ncbi:MAG TPA: HAMP domain-containing sensor histidine kinase [Gemmataceae bacterium]|nr:HAMP domain-containing sensor histidine kinase [Gemmataceae bacterium]
MRWSIRYRLLVPLGLLLLGVVATSIWSAVLAASHAKERIARRVLEVTETAAAANYPLTPNVLKQMKGYSGAEYLLAAADGARTSTFPEGPVELPAVAADHADGSAFGPTVEVNGVRYRFGRLMIRNHPNEGATLYIFYPESSLQEALWDAVRPSLVLGLFGGLAAVAVAIGIGQRLVSRIRELERRTRLIAGGDFSPMPLPRQNDELRDLSASVNEMAQRLAQLREAVQRTERLRLSGQLSSGLAHQLRNSVTGARLALEVLAEEHGLQESEAVGVILRQLDLMEANLRRFMDLGRTEGWKRERCSLMSLIDEAVALLRPQCDHAKIELVWKPTLEPVESEGDPGQLRDLFLNVIHNAVEAAGPGGTVEVRIAAMEVAKTPRHAIEVWDSGPGPPPLVADRLFEPFVTGKPEGIGLGLAVARQAAEAHGGRLDWRRENGRTCFRIELPVDGK